MQSCKKQGTASNNNSGLGSRSQTGAELLCVKTVASHIILGLSARGSPETDRFFARMAHYKQVAQDPSTCTIESLF